jgi:hypothetical protein
MVRGDCSIRATPQPWNEFIDRDEPPDPEALPAFSDNLPMPERRANTGSHPLACC